MVSATLAFAGVLVGVVAVYLALAPQRRVKRLASIDTFKRTRSYLKRQVGSLHERSLAEQERFRFDKELRKLRSLSQPYSGVPLTRVLPGA